MDLNKVMLIGNVVADPETRTTAGGQNLATLRIATNRRWKDQVTGELREDAQFHRVIAWGKLEELCSRYIKKGSKIFIEGRLQTRSWDDQQSGQKKFMTEVVAENIILLDRKGYSEGSTSSAATSSTGSSDTIKGQSQEDVSIPAPEQIPTINLDDNEEEIKVEDIPF